MTRSKGWVSWPMRYKAVAKEWGSASFLEKVLGRFCVTWGLQKKEFLTWAYLKGHWLIVPYLLLRSLLSRKGHCLKEVSLTAVFSGHPKIESEWVRSLKGWKLFFRKLFFNNSLCENHGEKSLLHKFYSRIPPPPPLPLISLKHFCLGYLFILFSMLIWPLFKFQL